MKLTHDNLLSSLSFKFKLRLYSTEELRESFKFTKYIMLTRVFHDEDQPAEGGKKRKRGEPVVVYPRCGPCRALLATSSNTL